MNTRESERTASPDRRAQGRIDLLHPRPASPRASTPESDEREASRCDATTTAPRPKVSLVIPVFNERQNLRELIARCLKTCGDVKKSFEIILVDDGSSDGSTQIIAGVVGQNPGRIIGVLLNRNYGQHAAIMAGFAESRGDMVVTLDADLQNPPEEIPKLVRKMEEGFDIVGTVRISRKDTFFRRMASRIVNKAARKATGVMMHDYGCMLRGYGRHVVDAMLQCHERSTFIPVLANTFARNATEIDVDHAERSVGNSKYGLWKLINLQFDLLTSMTTLPLRFLSVVGTLMSLSGIGLGILLLVMRLIHGPGWAAEGVFTLFAILFFFIGGQFVALGLLGEYIGRIYHDVRARPRYFIHEVIGRSGSEESDARSRKESEDMP